MSQHRRFFVDKITQPLEIDGEEFRHAIGVLRIKQNDTIIVCDGSGTEYLCNVDSIGKKSFSASVFDTRSSQTEAQTDVTLLVGYLKGDKTELVVQKAVELGLKRIVVFNSKFCSAYMNENKLARLNKVSQEASKQCGRAIAPKVDYFDTFQQALQSVEHCKNKLFACEFAKENATDFGVLQGSTAIVVGSEGGFSQQENDLAMQMGFSTVFLGKRILRAETACISLCAIVMHRLGELQ